MRRLEQQSDFEHIGQPEGETTIDTQAEVDLICGGVGFDDDPSDDGKWLEEARNRQRENNKSK